MHQDIDRAAKKAGIAESFTAIDGSQQFTSIETKVSLLAAMNKFSSSPLADDPCPIPAAYVFYQEQHYRIQLRSVQTLSWQLICENGHQCHGSITDSCDLTLPDHLEVGYHRLILATANNSWHSTIIIAPQRCYEPNVLINQQKIWGTTLQLYTVRSETNWGMGDFGDLHQLIDEIAKRGGAFIGLNPIHALYPANPESASPYSPSSRQWLNVLYINVNDLVEFQQSEAAQNWWHSPLTQERLNHARTSDWVNYSIVNDLKIAALRLSFDHFQQTPTSHRQQKFQMFIEQHGLALQQHATFDALHTALNINNENRWGWPVWPEELQSCHNEQVKVFADNHPNEILFFSWLQWLAHLQLAECDQHAKKSGMSIGLYRDLAVGVSEGSAAVWADKELYSIGASIGAPPDPLGPLGQYWGLPPMNPHVLQHRGYQPFIELLRANMSHCGAIRIDHVMSLLRLWWIPYGENSAQGAYVTYPVDDLLAILALESQRHQCMVIGEDLGTVPPEIVDKLHRASVYSYRVLYFQHNDANEFVPPQQYPQQAMATINTHDLPTLRSFWLSNDLALGSTLDLYPDRDKLFTLYRGRNITKLGLLRALYDANYRLKEENDVLVTLPMSDELSLAILRYMSSCHSLLLGLQLEDLLGMLLPVNIPGTSHQYANWRRKLDYSLNAIFADPQINHLLEEVNQIRRALNL